MKIYVVETLTDYGTQLGFSTSRKVAEQKCKEFQEQSAQRDRYPRDYWVEEYSEGKDLWCDFDIS